MNDRAALAGSAVPPLENRPFDELRVGDSASLTRTLTRADVKTFAVLSGDLNPTHVDDAYARAHGRSINSRSERDSPCALPTIIPALTRLFAARILLTISP